MYTIGGWNIEYIKSIHRIKVCICRARADIENYFELPVQKDFP